MRPLKVRHHAVARLLAEHRDVLDGRPAEHDEVPPALAARGWAAYLLALGDDALEALEAGGTSEAWPAGAPASLLALAAAVREVDDIAPLAPEGARADGPRLRRRFETPRKHLQVDAFARVVVPLAARAERVVDVGSGHGHLTRALADRLGMPVLGLERDPALARRARVLAGEGAASFTVVDVMAGELELSARDCLVGLHACGELGDAMVVNAARAGASLALVGCCLQKRRAEVRAPLVPVAGLGASLDLPRAFLGLSNLTSRDDAVEASRTDNLRARERRVALHRLLVGAGMVLPLGAEIEGLNRRAAHADLAVLAARAFALRGLPAPAEQDVTEAAAWAHVHHARMRRLALPRSLLARALEVFVLLDRASHLEACGYEVEVAVLFPAAVSARNLVVWASAH